MAGFYVYAAGRETKDGWEKLISFEAIKTDVT